jgi:NTE family protein
LTLLGVVHLVRGASAGRPESAHPGSNPVNLALQGGGAHGAFAWAVLDHLLEEKRIAFDGISATSAGAINATILASVWLRVGTKEPNTRSLNSGAALPISAR